VQVQVHVLMQVLMQVLVPVLVLRHLGAETPKPHRRWRRLPTLPLASTASSIDTARH